MLRRWVQRVMEFLTRHVARAPEPGPESEADDFWTICADENCRAFIRPISVYLCGDRWHATPYSCGGFFCLMHLYPIALPNGSWVSVCASCRERYLAEGQWV